MNDLIIDFSKGKTTYRLQEPAKRKQLLARAIGLQKTHTVIDATAGLGEDSFILADLGCNVMLIERSPTVYTLLHDAIKTAPQPAANNIHLIHDDSINYLSQLTKDHYPDVIYLDPMYEPRKKTALNKKPLRMLRTLVGDDPDAPELLTIALKRAKKRVVVKRHKQAPHLNDQTPDLILKGNTTRFDIYFPKS